MKHENMNTVSKRTALSAALCLALGAGAAQAAPWSGNFSMYSPGGFLFAPDTTVTGTEKSTLESSTPFFGYNWVAKSLTTYTSTFTVDTVEGGIYTGITPGAGQIGASLLFDWGATDTSTACGKANCNIDVIQIWDVGSNADGSTTYTSTDIDATGWAGAKMIDGPFQGYSANFNMTAIPDFTLALAGTQGGNSITAINRAGGNVTINSGQSSSGFTFDWSASDSALITAAVGGTTNSTLVFDPSNAGISLGSSYTAKITVTRTAGGATVSAELTVTIAPIALSSSVDTDGDGTDDAAEGFGDSDGDGIPEFLDASTVSTELVINTSDSSAGVIQTSTGALSLGDTAVTKGFGTLSTTPVYGATVTTNDIGDSDSVMESSCVGGCYDFKVTGLSNGGIAKVVIPLSTALPDYPIYRKYNNSKWGGFTINDNNSISSAAALTTSPITCPAPGDSAYSKVGLTPGDYCIQLTLEDGGGNDADGSTNGTIVDPGGVANGKQSRLEANVPSGCSMSTTPINPTERADWWLVAAFLGALAWLRGMRKKAHAA